MLPNIKNGVLLLLFLLFLCFSPFLQYWQDRPRILDLNWANYCRSQLFKHGVRQKKALNNSCDPFVSCFLTLHTPMYSHTNVLENHNRKYPPLHPQTHAPNTPTPPRTPESTLMRTKSLMMQTCRLSETRSECLAMFSRTNWPGNQSHGSFEERESNYWAPLGVVVPARPKDTIVSIDNQQSSKLHHFPLDIAHTFFCCVEIKTRKWSH